MSLAPPVAEVLAEGTLVYLAARDRYGPHLTPVVYAETAGRLWVTTARSSRKARVWRADPRTAGLVRAGERALVFRGEVTAYDGLDPRTWGRSALRAPLLTLASLRFTRKNLRFFAGYARDAHRVPLSWTPPGRVFVSVRPTDGALAGEGLTWGTMGTGFESEAAYRVLEPAPLADRAAPSEVVEAVGEEGEGAIAIEAGHRDPQLTVLPARWRRDAGEGAWYAIVREDLLALAGGGPEVPAALVADRTAHWRASEMTGLLLRGSARIYAPDRLRSGAGSVARRSGAGDGEIALRLRPDRAVWWKGWASGTVMPR